MIMANEFKLSFSGAEVEERLGKVSNTVLFTEQELTEEQKAQARANIGAISQLEKDSVITNISYTYDGDKESKADAVWVKNGRDLPIFLKVADLPKGKLNLVGSTVSLINRSNTWQNASFEITEEKLSEQVEFKYSSTTTIAKAKDNGFTQIFYLTQGESNPVTILCICELAGIYTVAFNDWEESLLFPEKGIYFIEQKPDFGGKYLATFDTSYTTTEGELDINPIEYTGNEIQVFHRGLCIGDSITHGSFNYEGGSAGGEVNKNYAYPTIFKRITGIDMVNSGIGGATSKTWYEASLDGDALGGRWVNGEWVWSKEPETNENDIVSQALDYSGFDFAIIHMGINDIGMRGELTVEEAAEQYRIYMNNIVNKLKTENQGIKIFLATIIPSYAAPGSYSHKLLHDILREIEAETENVYVVDLNSHSECKSGTAYDNQHLTAIGYHKLATELSVYISYIIKTNIEEFKEIQFIGTDKHI
jgi:lysophospholipase L1-like esterase